MTAVTAFPTAAVWNGRRILNKLMTRGDFMFYWCWDGRRPERVPVNWSTAVSPDSFIYQMLQAVFRDPNSLE